jgi:hypothetical protein
MFRVVIIMMNTNNNINRSERPVTSARRTTHAERDAIQRRAARDRYKAVRKSLPKEVRKREIIAERKALAAVCLVVKAGTRKGDSTPTRSGHNRFRKKKLQTDRLT